jgi:CBS domain containing-hemolysin-like protein
VTPTGTLWGLAGVVALLLLAAYLSAIETLLVRLPLVRALRLREEEARGSEPLLWLLEHRATSLNVVLLLTVTARITVAAIATWLALRTIGGAAGVAVVLALLVVLSLALAEVAPRTLTLRHLEATGLRLAASFRGLTRLLDPLASGFVALGRGLVRVRSDVSGPFAADEEVRDLAVAEDEDDELEDDERAMIHSIFELGDTVVREIMVPRPDMVTVDEDARLRELVNTIIERGYSRVPVRRGDEIVGVVFAKDVLKRLAHRPGVEDWRDLVRQPTYVPETKQIDALLRDLQASTVHQAIVVDEYGDVVGLVTIEDILEEIVGEIVDEYDHEAPLVEIVDDGHLRVDARLPVDDLNELLDTDLPEEGWDTVGGLVVGTLGRVPAAGEQIDIDGVSLLTERVQGRRVSRVLVSRRERPDDDTSDDVDDDAGDDR